MTVDPYLDISISATMESLNIKTIQNLVVCDPCPLVVENVTNLTRLHCTVHTTDVQTRQLDTKAQ